MLTIEEALPLVCQAARPLPAEKVPLADAVGRRLAEDVASDCDVPPHDKALVDGYAVRSADFQCRATQDEPAAVELAVVEEVTAGSVPTVPLTAGHATRIMTGAPLPANADAVVMVEDTTWQPETGVRLGVMQCRAGLEVKTEMNLMRRASSIRRGQIVLHSGSLVRPAEAGLLAEVGVGHVRVGGRPCVAVLSTGNELVDKEMTPGPGQIRNSNGPMFLAWAKRIGAATLDLGIVRDNSDAIENRVKEGLGADVLLISGGVSAGVLDLVPQVLLQLGVRELFHKVQLRPGRPLWFGVHDGGVKPVLVFGLPGNPVGGLVCCELFVAAALKRLMGSDEAEAPAITATLAGAYHQRGNRPTFHPARLRSDGSTTLVETVTWLGSSDLRALAEADCWAIFPAGERRYQPGETICCRPFIGQ
jgi:molybdopterin molybdotransferase